MAGTNVEISKSVEAIRKAVYGKDVREAIAHGIELCYDYVGGQAALDAAIQAREAVDRLQAVVDNSEEAINGLNQAVEDVGELVIVSDTQPTNPENKIWVRPQADQEYKVATFEAYAALWNHVNDLNNVYEQGHGGIASIIQNPEYVDESEEETDENGRLIKQYIITFSDGATSSFLIKNGERGGYGPPDGVEDMTIEYAIGQTNNVGAAVMLTDPYTNKKYPAVTTQWSTDLPTINPGDLLWTRTTNIFESGQITYIYSVGRQGLNGQGSMNSIRLGANGTSMSGDVVIGMDSSPTAGSTNLINSGNIAAAITQAINNAKESPAFIGTPTAPTAEPGTRSTQIATTEFVDTAVTNSQINTDVLFASPAFTGTPTAPTAAEGTKTIQVATTEFVQTAAENAALSALLNIHAYTLTKTSSTSKKFAIGIPPGTRHLLIFDATATGNSAMVKVHCNNSGAINYLNFGSGAYVSFEKNYNSSTDCALRMEINSESTDVKILDFVLYHNSKTPSWEDASIKSSITAAQAFL